MLLGVDTYHISLDLRVPAGVVLLNAGDLTFAKVASTTGAGGYCRTCCVGSAIGWRRR
ncbi:hypothetical protein GCM10027569_22020 [Flindersiella endophytica]